MKVHLIKVGGEHMELRLDADSTVGEALEKADISAEGCSVLVNKQDADLDDVLDDGDFITLGKKVSGGV